MTNYIWNMTNICAYDCKICCVDASHVSKQDDNIIIKEKGLSCITQLSAKKNVSRYEQAHQYLVQQGRELSLDQKMKVLFNISDAEHIDFSGGDPLLLKENFEVIETASHLYGRNALSITATGVGFAQSRPEVLAQLVGEIEFTYDEPQKKILYRPIGYNNSNIKKVMDIASYDVGTTAQTPLTKNNIDVSTIKKIYSDLTQASIDRVVLMRLIPSGRGINKMSISPTRDEYSQAVDLFLSLEKKLGGPQVLVQSILDQHIKGEDSIHSYSHNITSSGLLLSSPWAYDPLGKPLEDFVMGSLLDTNSEQLQEIFSQKKNTLETKLTIQWRHNEYQRNTN